jgi:hypothetical protein
VSYCSHTQRFEHRSGVPISFEQRFGGSTSALSRHRRADHRQLAASRMRAIIERRLVAELLDRQVGHHIAAMLDDEAQVVVV